ncbi:UBX domain-containing protein [Delphinella strobiligena]|nr:UBX domain-containing protein [Delphinella strobiligena]
MMDEAVANFTAITSADPAQAQQYLTLTDGNLEQAIQLYFDSDGADMGASVPQQPPTQPAHSSGAPRSAYTEDEHGVVTIDSDEDGDSSMGGMQGGGQRSNVYEDDEAMARRIQQEMYGQAGAEGEEEVRAPMARTTETLVGPDAPPYYGGGDDDNMQAAVMEQLANRQRRAAGRPGIFNQRIEQSVWDDNDPEAQRQARARMTGGASEQSNKTNLLAQLFQPPVDIISSLSWADARDEGKEQEKWLLVNVQDASVFDCSALNRDIWRNAQVKETIKENFIFMQFNKDDPKAAQYVNYYLTHNRDNESIYPHIAIVDPRTGEQVKIWSGSPIPTASDFLMDLHEFLDRYSLNAFAKNPVATRKPEQKTKDVDRMTEEEMLEMAMQNSLNNKPAASGEASNAIDPDALTKSQDKKGKAKLVDAAQSDVTDTGPPLASSNEPTTEAEASPFAQIPSDRPHTEPTDPATSTRIQFRYSGGRQIRRFALEEPVSRIYEWLKASPIDGKEGVQFELMFMGKNLMHVLDKTIDEAGLKNGSVMVEFIEDS